MHQPPLVVESVREALVLLRQLYGPVAYGSGEDATVTAAAAGSKGARALGRVFVIGGQEAYVAALRRRACRRVLLTRVVKGFECDVFFPLELGLERGEETEVMKEEQKVGEEGKAEERAEEEAGEDAAGGMEKENKRKKGVGVDEAANEENWEHAAGMQNTAKWVRKSQAELSAWVGENVPAGKIRHGDVEWEYEMWEKESDGDGRYEEDEEEQEDIEGVEVDRS